MGFGEAVEVAHDWLSILSRLGERDDSPMSEHHVGRVQLVAVVLGGVVVDGPEASFALAVVRFPEELGTVLEGIVAPVEATLAILLVPLRYAKTVSCSA